MSEIVLWIRKTNTQNVVFHVLAPQEKEDGAGVLHLDDLAQIQRIPQELMEVIADWCYVVCSCSTQLIASWTTCHVVLEICKPCSALSDSTYNDKTLHLLLSIWQLLLESCRTEHLLKQQKYIKLIHYILSHPFLLEVEENLLWFSTFSRTCPWMQNVALCHLTEIM